MNWNYEEIAKKLAMGRIDLEEESIPFMLDEARKRHDGDVLASLASVWFEDVKGDKRRAVELFVEAAGLGSPDANYRLGHECRSGEILPRDYEKAYVSFRKGEECDWVPIDPEDNMSIMEDSDGEVTSEFLLLHGSIDWWQFLLANHPNRALKCGMADWYMQQGGDENREKALKLFADLAVKGDLEGQLTLVHFKSSVEESKELMTTISKAYNSKTCDINTPWGNLCCLSAATCGDVNAMLQMAEGFKGKNGGAERQLTRLLYEFP